MSSAHVIGRERGANRRRADLAAVVEHEPAAAERQRVRVAHPGGTRCPPGAGSAPGRGASPRATGAGEAGSTAGAQTSRTSRHTRRPERQQPRPRHAPEQRVVRFLGREEVRHPHVAEGPAPAASRTPPGQNQRSRTGPPLGYIQSPRRSSIHLTARFGSQGRRAFQEPAFLSTIATTPPGRSTRRPRRGPRRSPRDADARRPRPRSPRRTSPRRTAAAAPSRAPAASPRRPPRRASRPRGRARSPRPRRAPARAANRPLPQPRSRTRRPRSGPRQARSASQPDVVRGRAPA